MATHARDTDAEKLSQLAQKQRVTINQSHPNALLYSTIMMPRCTLLWKWFCKLSLLNVMSLSPSASSERLYPRSWTSHQSPRWPECHGPGGTQCRSPCECACIKQHGSEWLFVETKPSPSSVMSELLDHNGIIFDCHILRELTGYISWVWADPVDPFTAERWHLKVKLSLVLGGTQREVGRGGEED